MIDKKNQIKADMMLVLVTLCWGTSYLLTDYALEELAPFNLNAIRFLGAFIIIFVLAFPRLKDVNKTTLKYSVLIGVALYFVYIGATFGVMYTSISNAGFLCALTVVITPIFAFFFKGQKPDKKFLIVLLMALVGIVLLTIQENLTFAIGDIICLMCAVFYAIDLLITETAVAKEEVNAFQLGVYQLGVTGVLCLITTLAIEKQVVPHTPKVWFSVIFLMIFCTGLAFVIQAIAQQYTTASHVGVIFTLEPVFSGICAFFFAGEILLPRAYFGAFLLVASLFVMEIDFSTIFGKKGTKNSLE